MAQGKKATDDACRAGGRGEVSDVRLDGVEPAVADAGSGGSKCPGRGINLQRVPDAGARTVPFEQADAGGPQLGDVEGFFDQFGLAGDPWRREARALSAIVVDRGASDDAEDRVTGGQRHIQPAQEEGGNTVAVHRAVGRGHVGLAPTSR